MSADWKELERRIADLTKSGRGQSRSHFLDAEPVNIEKFEGSELSCRSFWRLASDGRTFDTGPENHLSAPWAPIRTTSRCLRTGKKKRSKH